MNRASLRWALIALGAMTTWCAQAQQTDWSSVLSFSGFGTVGVAHSSLDSADFTSTIFKPNGAGHTHDWSMDVDGVFGLQMAAKFSSQWSLVVQAITQQSYNSSYEPTLEWANLHYQPTADISVRFGREVLPAFLYSDSIDVGYTYPWVRPPLEVYWLDPVTINDGVTASYRHNWGDLASTLQVNWGVTRSPLPHDQGDVVARKTFGVTDTLSYGALSVLLDYQYADLDFPGIHPLFQAFSDFGPDGAAIAAAYDSDHRPYDAELVSINYQPGRYFVTGEWVRSYAHSFVGNSIGWYLSSGYRFGSLTPFLTYAHVGAVGNHSAGLDTTGLPDELAGEAYGLNAALQGLLASIPVQHTWSIGARWDVLENVDLKVQLDRTSLGAGSSGTLINLQPNFQTGSSYTVFSAAVDFIF